MRSKTMCLGVFEPTKWLATQSTTYTLCHPLGQQACVKVILKISM